LIGTLLKKAGYDPAERAGVFGGNARLLLGV
jgi:hypothetical protein